jgi:hypothetical protein
MKAPPPKSAFGNMADLDVKHAWKALGGKSAEDAYQGFKEAAFPQVENFRWIAPEAFVYYFPVVLRYLMSDDSKGDSDTVSCFAGILESQLDDNRQALAAIFKDIAVLSKHIIRHYGDYDVSYDIYGDLKSRYEKIAKEVEHLSSPGGQ